MIALKGIINSFAQISLQQDIKGSDIQIKMFDNCSVIEGPGKAPGTVRPYNMRYVHLLKKPKIAAFLHESVQEFGEEVDLLYFEMEKSDLPSS